MLKQSVKPLKGNSISASLPNNYIQTAWEELGGRYSKSYIQKVASGVRKNLEIMEVLISIAKKYQNSLDQISRSIADLSGNNPNLSY